MAPSIKKIFSKNNDFQHIEVLKRNRQKRHQFGELFVEGVIPLNRLAKSGWEISTLLFSNDKPLSGWARDFLVNSRADKHLDLSLELLAELSDKEDPSEILAVAKIPKDDLKRITLGKPPLLVVLDRPSSPGNLGSTIRSADAFGADGIVITGHAADVYDPGSVRASRGSLFGPPIIRLESAKELLQWIEELRPVHPDLQIVGTSLDATEVISHHNFIHPTVLIMGNEATGMSRAYQELCTSLVTIPMYGTADSLNVSCAASIVLYEVRRQRS